MVLVIDKIGKYTTLIACLTKEIVKSWNLDNIQFYQLSNP